MKNLIDPQFERKIIANFPNAQEWLDRLPQHLNELSQNWSLMLEEPFGGLSYHYVVPATLADGTRAVLKTGPDGGEMKHQAIALKLYQGEGMCRLIQSDLERVAILLERAEPGITLWGLCTEENDAKLTEIAASVMRRILRPSEKIEGLPTLNGWMQGLARMQERISEQGAGIPVRLAEMAVAFATELADGPNSLLHGDLHHGNILSHGENWIAIDPKGVIGDPAFEPSAFLHNPLDSLFQFTDPKAALARRLEIFSEILGIDRERILKWAFAGCVLSVWWGVEDEGHVWAEGLQCAEWLSQLL